MDSISNVPRSLDGNSDSQPRAELVLQNTRQSGTRIPIDGFAVLMGRSSKCDVQLDVDGIQPLHCILIDGPEGFLVRGVSDGTITVNDQQVDSILLADGDQLAIGSFVFQIEIHEASSVDRDERVALQKARSAVRIQAAAVAAQQAALDEEEQRLNLQRVALDRQQEQLATHLEERRRELEEMWHDLSVEREESEAERELIQQELNEVNREKATLRASIQDVEKEKKRLQSDYDKRSQRDERLRQEQAALAEKQAEELQTALDRLKREKEGLQRDRADLNSTRLRINGEAEVARCQLRESWDSIARAQKELEQRLDQEAQQQAQRNHILEERERLVVATEKAQAALLESHRKKREALEKEIAGLENRANNLRPSSTSMNYVRT